MVAKKLMGFLSWPLKTSKDNEGEIKKMYIKSETQQRIEALVKKGAKQYLIGETIGIKESRMSAIKIGNAKPYKSEIDAIKDLYEGKTEIAEPRIDKRSAEYKKMNSQEKVEMVKPEMEINGLDALVKAIYSLSEQTQILAKSIKEMNDETI
jgi:hypothetical protein